MNDEKSCRGDVDIMQSEGKHEYTKKGLSPDPDNFNCEQYPELRKLKRGSDPL